MKDVKLRRALLQWVKFQFIDVAPTNAVPKEGDCRKHPISILLEELSASPNKSKGDHVRKK